MQPHTGSNSIQSKPIPKSRVHRLSKLGGLVSKVAGNMLKEGSKSWVKGQAPSSKELLLTAKNAQHFSEHLAQMRGAAMKVGQLLSMDAGDLIPEELADILSRLRSEGTSMPISQLNGLLENAWGKDWNTQFMQFSFYPIAAASIGQVHRAKTKEGQHLAIKIQYEGIKTCIDSDVDNLASLLKLSRLIPKEVNLAPILDEAKKQLHDEANYQHEAHCLQSYQQHLGNDPRFKIPKIYPQLTTEQTLAMEFVEGQPIESRQHASQSERNAIMTALFELLFRELFEFQLVQTDPNFANYLYNPDNQQIVLLDFGATRSYPDAISQGYLKLMQGAISNRPVEIEQAAHQIGFFQENILPGQKQAVLELFAQACEPLVANKIYDFGESDLAQRIKDKGMALSLELNYWHTPPADAIFFHRKLGGLYLLAARLKAQVNVHELFVKVSQSLDT